MHAVSRHSAFQAAQRAFRSNRLLHEIGRRNLPLRQKAASICKKLIIHQDGGRAHAMRNEFYLISKEGRGASFIAVMFQAEVA